MVSNTITDIPAGTHTVVARFVGFRELRVTVTIVAGQETEQKLYARRRLPQYGGNRSYRPGRQCRKAPAVVRCLCPKHPRD